MEKVKITIPLAQLMHGRYGVSDFDESCVEYMKKQLIGKPLYLNTVGEDPRELGTVEAVTDDLVYIDAHKSVLDEIKGSKYISWEIRYPEVKSGKFVEKERKCKHVQTW